MISLQSFEQWEAVNQTFHHLVLNKKIFTGDFQLRVGPGVGAHLQDLVISTSQFYSHKKSCAVIAGQSPWIDKVLPFLYKDGFDVQIYSEKCGDYLQWCDGLKAETLFVLFAADHAVTGERLPVAEIDKKLNDKKIYSISVSHTSYQFLTAQPVLSFALHLCALDNNFSFCVFGSRYKAPSLFSPLLNWDLVPTLTIRQQDKTLVDEFEKLLPPGFQLYKSNSTNFTEQLHDRVIFYHPKLGGDSVIHFLENKLNLQLLNPQKNIHWLETTHLCRSGGSLKQYEWWMPRPNDDQLRGLLILDVNFFKQAQCRVTVAQFCQQLALAIEECQIG